MEMRSMTMNGLPSYGAGDWHLWRRLLRYRPPLERRRLNLNKQIDSNKKHNQQVSSSSMKIN